MVEHPQGISVRVRVIPNAKTTGMVGIEEGVLVVRLTAPPVEGKANAALLEYLGKRLGLRKSQLSLLSGDKSRHKVVLFAGVQREDLARLLDEE